MAKQPSSKSATSRIRFIVLEAEIQDGDLSQITSAIQSALKPTTTIIQQRISTSSPAALPNGIGAEGALENIMIDDEEEMEVEPAPRRTPRETKPRKPVAMKVLDIDLTSGLSFDQFANRHSPKNDTERNLVVLAWFKENRPDEAVTAHHVYTCYRAMKWPSGIDDFSGTLRQLKRQQLVNGAGRGEYVINHLGIARVEELSS